MCTFKMNKNRRQNTKGRIERRKNKTEEVGKRGREGICCMLTCQNCRKPSLVIPKTKLLRMGTSSLCSQYPVVKIIQFPRKGQQQNLFLLFTFGVI